MVFKVSKDICDGHTYRFNPLQFVAVALVFAYGKHEGKMFKSDLSYDFASGSEITPCNKIDKPLEVYKFSENFTTSITMLRT